MNKLLSIALILFSSSAAFSQTKTTQPTFTASANTVVVNSDSSETRYLGKVNIVGEKYRFEGADSVIFSKKEKTLTVFNPRKKDIKNVPVVKLNDAKKEIIVLRF